MQLCVHFGKWMTKKDIFELKRTYLNQGPWPMALPAPCAHTNG